MRQGRCQRRCRIPGIVVHGIYMLNHVLDSAVYEIFHCGNYDDMQFIRSVMDLPSVACLVKVSNKLCS